MTYYRITLSTDEVLEGLIHNWDADEEAFYLIGVHDVGRIHQKGVGRKIAINDCRTAFELSHDRAGTPVEDVKNQVMIWKQWALRNKGLKNK